METVRQILFHGMLGCSNHGCIIEDPVGAGTNGPCNCLKKLSRAQLDILKSRLSLIIDSEVAGNMKKIIIDGISHYFTKVGDIYIGANPVSIAQYQGDPDGSNKPITELTRDEVLAWCKKHGCRLPTEKEWEEAAIAGVVNKTVEEDDVWEEIGPGRTRVLRGGSWLNSLHYCRVVSRLRSHPGDRSDRVGFRVVYKGDS